MTDRDSLAAHSAAPGIGAPTDNEVTRLISPTGEPARASQPPAAALECSLALSVRSLDATLAVAKPVAPTASA